MKIHETFTTPVITKYWEQSEELNSSLQQIILDMVSTNAGLQNSNVGGYHSDTQFLHQDTCAINDLRNRVMQMTRTMAEYYGLPKDTGIQVKLAAWANVMKHGHYHRLHSHPDYHWSGVYYVNAGKPLPDSKPNGHLQFADPRAGANRMAIAGLELSPALAIAPIAGLMVMFPSYLEHYVHPFFGEGERVSVAFNVRVENLKSLCSEGGFS